MITGNVIGAILKDPGTIILVDEEGNEYPAVMTGEEVELTATVNDVRLGKTVALESGIETGEKEIPAYHTSEGLVGIPNGSVYKIPRLDHLNLYDFTKLQAIICDLNTNPDDSVSADKICLHEGVYLVKSTDLLSNVIRDSDEKCINLGVTNDTGNTQILRYFTYKEIL